MNHAVKHTLLLLFTLLLSLSVWAQAIQEVCTTAPPNGTMVDCQYFQDTLYATGFFTQICGESVGYIAKWDSGKWKPSALNISDPGHALKVIDSNLYIAKYVESIDSNWVYVYDGTTLDKLGTGVYLTTASGFSELPNIYDIVEFGGNLIACGEFDRVGGDTIQGIMQWDGTKWSGLGGGLSGNIAQTAPVMFPHKMLVHDGALYVGGNFRTAGGVEVNGIAKWDGTNWSSMGAGFNGTVYSMVVHNGELIVGGSFTESNGTPLNRIAKWDGTDWVALDFGFVPSSGNDFIFVHTLNEIDSVLYIGGGLKQILYADSSTEVCNGIVAYSGDSLNTFMGGVPNNDIEAICKIADGQLVVGGGVFNGGYTGVVEIPITTQIASSPKPEIRVFPNPFTDHIRIQSAVEIDTYELTDLTGRVVARGVFKQEIKVEGTAGMYMLTLHGKNLKYSLHTLIKR